MPQDNPQNRRPWPSHADVLAHQAAARQSLARSAAAERAPSGRPAGSPEEAGSIGDLAGNVEELQQTIAGNRRAGIMAMMDDLKRRYRAAPEPWMMQGAGGGRTVTALKFDDPDQTTFSAFPLFGDDGGSEPNVVFKGSGKTRRWSFGDGVWRDADKDWPIVR